jgi:hypothetical protein
MCPACFASFALAAGGAVSAGALAAFAGLHRRAARRLEPSATENPS